MNEKEVEKMNNSYVTFSFCDTYMRVFVNVNACMCTNA